MTIELLNEDNFEPYAMRNYRNDFCFDLTEFHDDLRSIRYIKILINRYKNTGSLQERLILNHLITMSNVFTQILMLFLIGLKMVRFWLPWSVAMAVVIVLEAL